MDTTTYWMCERCSYCTSAARPPDKCPHCGEACTFRDVTCYRPECGGPGNIDPLLVGNCRGFGGRYPINA